MHLHVSLKHSDYIDSSRREIKSEVKSMELKDREK